MLALYSSMPVAGQDVAGAELVPHRLEEHLAQPDHRRPGAGGTEGPVVAVELVAGSARSAGCGRPLPQKARRWVWSFFQPSVPASGTLTLGISRPPDSAERMWRPRPRRVAGARSAPRRPCWRQHRRSGQRPRAIVSSNDPCRPRRRCCSPPMRQPRQVELIAVALVAVSVLVPSR